MSGSHVPGLYTTFDASGTRPAALADAALAALLQPLAEHQHGGTRDVLAPSERSHPAARRPGRSLAGALHLRLGHAERVDAVLDDSSWRRSVRRRSVLGDVQAGEVGRRTMRDPPCRSRPRIMPAQSFGRDWCWSCQLCGTGARMARCFPEGRGPTVNEVRPAGTGQARGPDGVDGKSGNNKDQQDGETVPPPAHQSLLPSMLENLARVYRLASRNTLRLSRLRGRSMRRRSRSRSRPARARRQEVTRSFTVPRKPEVVRTSSPTWRFCMSYGRPRFSNRGGQEHGRSPG